MSKQEITISDELLTLIGKDSRLVVIRCDEDEDLIALAELVNEREDRDCIMILPRRVT